MVGHLSFAALGVVMAAAVAAVTENSIALPGDLTPRGLGALGTALILLALLYPLRKRKLLRWGTMRQWLAAHEALGTVGPLVLVVHSGMHFDNTVAALAEGLAVLMMFSGFVGRSFYRGVASDLGGLRTELEREGLCGVDLEERLGLAAGASQLLSRWRVVHYPLTAAFHVAAISHILTVFYYGGLLL